MHCIEGFFGMQIQAEMTAADLHVGFVGCSDDAVVFVVDAQRIRQIGGDFGFVIHLHHQRQLGIGECMEIIHHAGLNIAHVFVLHFFQHIFFQRRSFYQTCHGSYLCDTRHLLYSVYYLGRIIE